MERHRSWLFSPASAPDRCLKALRAGADQVVWDLEDGVAPGDKEAARVAVIQLLQSAPPTVGMPWIRINPPHTPEGGRDLDALERLPADRRRIMVAKADRAAVDHLLARGWRGPFLLLIESARGLWDLRADWTAAPPDIRLAFGTLDYQADLGLDPGPDQEELHAARHELVLASRRWGWPPPIDGVVPEYGDEAAVLKAAGRAKKMGFDGMMAIHPRQVPLIHRAFAPTADEVGWAHRILSRWETSTKGVQAVADTMVDRPLVERARRILAHADVSEEPSHDS
jgi:citrate lyase beta subunit